jgi:DNA adenine methylase
MKPIIKWPGGKVQLLPKIKELLPSTYNKYYEPFLGGGAVLLDLNPKEAIVNDINPELINMYLQVRDNVEEVITDLADMDSFHEHSGVDPKAVYYRVREDYNLSLGCNTPTQAARFIYLNKHCFNGLYRVNSKGEFNVPFNGKLTGGSFDADHLRTVSKQIQNVEFLCGDFEDCLATAEACSFCFIDSPYASLTPTSFVDYTKEGFAYEDHVRLARVFKELTDRGCYCMLTNHDTELIRDLYRGFNFTEVDVRRSINRNGDNRKGKEVIITNY